MTKRKPKTNAELEAMVAKLGEQVRRLALRLGEVADRLEVLERGFVPNPWPIQPWPPFVPPLVPYPNPQDVPQVPLVPHPCPSPFQPFVPSTTPLPNVVPNPWQAVRNDNTLHDGHESFCDYLNAPQMHETIRSSIIENGLPRGTAVGEVH
jgi:hypothetical protein